MAGDIIDPDTTLGRKARAGLKAGGFYGRWLPTLVVGKGQLPAGYAEFGPLATHLRYLERASRRLARDTFYGMARWQGRLERKQAFLGRVVDIGAELFAMSAACVRARTEDAPPRAGSWRTSSATRPGCEWTRCSPRCGTTPTPGTSPPRGRCSTAATLSLEEGILAHDDDRPWVASWAPGPTQTEDVRRRVGR